MKPKRLILIRHAHRDTDLGRSQDNGLSEKGLQQVKHLIQFAKNRLDFDSASDDEIAFFTSPKVRCQETVTPLALKFRMNPSVDSRLDEYGRHETEDQYLSRLDEFTDHWKFECPNITVVCSHGDWIPTLVQRLTGAKIGIKKAGWVEIEFIAGECFLTWIVQRPY
jgi:broad specificity phosphatase PhoE